MSDKTIQFDVSSPDELREALASYTKKGTCFASVRVFGPNVLTRQFNFPRSSARELMAGLKMEASETLSMKVIDLELAHQITGTDEQGIHGIYSVTSRHLLMQYLKCFDAYQLVPVSLTASAVGSAIDFLKDEALAWDNFCLVNLLKPHAVHIIVFANAKPVFFRELYDLSDNDYKDKITDTIRYSCRHSAIKNIDHIYFIGELTGKADLINNLKKLENASLSSPVTVPKRDQVDLTGLNLLENFVLGLEERSKLISIFSSACVISLLCVIILAWHASEQYLKLYDARSKVNMGDYYHALELQKKLGLSHEQ